MLAVFSMRQAFILFVSSNVSFALHFGQLSLAGEVLHRRSGQEDSSTSLPSSTLPNKAQVTPSVTERITNWSIRKDRIRQKGGDLGVRQFLDNNKERKTRSRNLLKSIAPDHYESYLGAILERKRLRYWEQRGLSHEEANQRAKVPNRKGNRIVAVANSSKQNTDLAVRPERLARIHRMVEKKIRGKANSGSASESGSPEPYINKKEAMARGFSEREWVHRYRNLDYLRSVQRKRDQKDADHIVKKLKPSRVEKIRAGMSYKESFKGKRVSQSNSTQSVSSPSAHTAEVLQRASEAHIRSPAGAGS